MAAHDADPPPGTYSAHRSEALADGVYAIAMTLLVIELKLPEAHDLSSSAELAHALDALLPKAIAWCISFFVLALFWVGHHRVFHHLRRADGRLVMLNLAQLAAVTLIPFSCALSGEFSRLLLSQVVYSINMLVLALTALAIARHVHRHPELSSRPMPRATYEAARLRIGGLIAISVLSSLIGAVVSPPAVGNMAFMLMIVVNPLSRRIERRRLAEATAAT